jgi:ATP-binding cassette, subfamily B, bacterial
LYKVNNGTIFYNSFYLILFIILFGSIASIGLVILASYFSEKVASDLRSKIINSISNQSFFSVNEIGSSKILTAATMDTDNTKNLISQGITAVLSAVVLLIGSAIMMLAANWKLGLIAVFSLPFIFAALFGTFSRIGVFFKRMSENTSSMNKTISETIFGAGLIRVLGSQMWENSKFKELNDQRRSTIFGMVKLFAALFPVIELISQSVVLIIIWFAANQIVTGTFTLGGLTAFISYFALLIAPLFILSFTLQNLTQATVSYGNIAKIIDQKPISNTGHHTKQIIGNIEVKNLNLTLTGKNILKNINLQIKAGTKTAILGPTAAGKSQLFNMITSLSKPTSGTILIDNVETSDWNQESLLDQIGLVFQDSILFNDTINANIAFHSSITQSNLDLAIQTAGLKKFIDTLPDGLNTIVSERGNSLSGGQKQRLMLARALANQPKILLLDDFTARVDNETEKQIWSALKANYPNLTLITITQKISSIIDFDKIIVLEEGEIVGTGTHTELMQNCTEYQLIAKSQETF